MRESPELRVPFNRALHVLAGVEEPVLIHNSVRDRNRIEKLLGEGCSREELGTYVSDRGKARFWERFPE